MPQDQGYTLEQQRALALARARRRRAEQEAQGGPDSNQGQAQPQGVAIPRGVFDVGLRGTPVGGSGTRRASFASGALDGATFGFGDELVGAGANAVTRLQNIFRAEEDRLDPNLVGSVATETIRGAQGELAQEMPVSNIAGQAAGAIGTSLAAVPAAAAAAPATVARIGTAVASAPLRAAAVIGGLEGGVYGVGSGETAGERAIGGGIGAGLGAVFGPATVAALGFGGRVTTGIGNRLLNRGAREGAEEAVNPAAVRFLNRTGLADDIRSRPEALSPGQDGDFLAERLGARGRSAAIGLAGSADEAQDVAETAIGARAGGRADRVANAARSATELPPVEADSVIRPEVTALMGLDDVRAAARPLFNAADEAQGRVSPRMREIFRDLNRAGVTFRNADELAARSGNPRVALSAFADDIDGLPNEVRLGDVRAMARAAENEARRLNRAGEDAGELWNMARELRDQIGRQSPEYREAARLWRSAARDDEAFDLGTRVLGGGRNNARLEREINRFVNGTGGPDAASPATQSERRAFLAGLSDAITTLTDSTSPTGNPATRISNERIRRRIRMVLGDDAAEELLDRINLENRQSRFETVANREVQSATEPRLAGRELVERGRAGGVQNVFAELIENPVEFIRLRQGRRQVADFIRSGDDDALAQVARVLYSQSDMADDPLVRAVLQEAQRRGLPIAAAPGGAVAGQNLVIENQR